MRKSSHIVCTWKVFHQSVFCCVSSVDLLLCKNSYIVCMWMAFLLSESSCVFWGHQIVRWSKYIVGNWKVLLQSESSCVSLEHQLLCKRSHIVGIWKAFHLNVFLYVCLEGTIFFADIAALSASIRLLLGRFLEIFSLVDLCPHCLGLIITWQVSMHDVGKTEF